MKFLSLRTTQLGAPGTLSVRAAQSIVSCDSQGCLSIILTPLIHETLTVASRIPGNTALDPEWSEF